ncbi:hypothetical protein N1495_09580 [Streptococcus didelphis]|uniref:hypothetical protein n=1 Tax=Streptococcus didelphis TaxID=102886 RepID=UPI0027D31F52|nr:hypothetical protein [Streptococcus didelphis]WMB29497.1 hypothetical protein N1495_09580 [Streptococcus didelphis]
MSGNDNVVGSHFGEGSTFSIKGDAINRSSIIENSVASDVSYKTEVQIPWEQVHQEITNIISTQIFSHQMNMVLEELQEASKNKNEEQFEKIVKNNERIFDLPFLKSAISATLANLISGILGY